MDANLELIRDTLAFLAEPRQGSDGIYVPTTTLMPGGELVGVLVTREGEDRFRVSDNGAGREAILDAGVTVVGSGNRRRASEIANRAGLEIDGDAFVLRDVSADQLAAAVIYVADASRSWAQAVLNRAFQRHKHDIGEVVLKRLEAGFGASKVKSDVVLLGESSSQHRFDFVVELAGSRRALFDVVAPAQQSISATHLKFYDMQREHADWPREAVIENPSDWTSAHLALLNQVANHIRPIADEWVDLQRLAA